VSLVPKSTLRTSKTLRTISDGEMACKKLKDVIVKKEKGLIKDAMREIKLSARELKKE